MSRSLIRFVSGVLALIAAAARSRAVEAEEAARPITDSPPSSAPDVRRREKPADGTVSDASSILVPSLRGCIITTDAAAGLREQARLSGGAMADGLPAPDKAPAEAAVAGFIGKPVSLDSLDRMAAAVESALQHGSGRMMRASWPDQEITGGVVVMLVKPAVAGQVTVHGDPKFGQDFVREQFRIRKSDALTRAAISEDLDWLNENPLRRARVSFGSGSGEDDVDLALHVEADRPWRVYAGFDNSLSDRLGDERWFLGFQHGDLWHLDHRVTLQLTGGFDLDALRGASFSYEIPLPCRHLLEFSASASESSSEQSGSGGPIDQDGTFQRYALKYRIPLGTRGGWKLEWYSGASFRDHAYDISGSESTVHFFQLETGAQLQKSGRRGSTTLGAALLWTPGWLSSADEVFDDLGADGADSLIFHVNADRSFTLGKSGTITARVDAQWAGSQLLSADQFAPAVNGRVRGFDEISAYGDSGISAVMEYLSPALRTPAGNLRGVAFLDAAVTRDRDESDNAELVAAGLGCRWQWKHLAAACDVGIPVHASDGIDTGARLRFSLSARW